MTSKLLLSPTQEPVSFRQVNNFIYQLGHTVDRLLACLGYDSNGDDNEFRIIINVGSVLGWPSLNDSRSSLHGR
jgi:hypothetical protein